MLSGTLPSDIGDMLLSLEILYLGANKFEGQIPNSLGNASFKVGTNIYMSSNYFIGQIPIYWLNFIN